MKYSFVNGLRKVFNNMKLSLWYRTKTVACLLRIISILPNVEGITSRGLTLLAETNFKSNYEPTSALKGSSSNYYYRKPLLQPQQQLQDEKAVFNNYYSDSGKVKLNIVNDTPLTREEQTGFVAGANGFVPTSIIAAGQQTINGYNSNNGNFQNMYGNNYLNNNNHNNNQNSNQHEFNVDVAENSFVGNFKKYMNIPKHETFYTTINNRNYVPTTSTGNFQYEQPYVDDGHYDEENQQQQQQQQQHIQTNTPISYLHDYQNMQQEEEQKHYDGDLDENIFSIKTTQLPKGIYNTQTTNFLQQHQHNEEREQQLGILRQLQKLTLTNNENLESRNKQPKYYDQQQQYQPLHSRTRTIVHHNPQSEAALADIPLARHVEVTKQVPVVVEHQRILQPYNQSVPVEVPQTVINTQSRPVPIEVPVAHTIAVPEIRDLHIPIEKLHPYPVERPIPYMVERHKPYTVERQVAIPYYYPYPIRVPIVKTVVHKSPAHKHAKAASAHGGGWVIKRVQRQPASLFH